MFAPCGFRREAFYPCYGLAEATLIVSGGFKAAAAGGAHLRRQGVGKQPGGRCPAGRRRRTRAGRQRRQPARPANRDRRSGNADHAAPIDRIGEIWVSGPSVAQGYWRDAEETEQTFRAYLNDTGDGPFLRTGDLGFLQDGELFVTGRLKDLIIIRGLNHYPQDIELTVGNAATRAAAGQAAAFTVDAAARERLVDRARNRARPQAARRIRRRVRGDPPQRVAAEHEFPVEAIVLIKAGSIPKTSSGKFNGTPAGNVFCDGTIWKSSPNGVLDGWYGRSSPHRHGSLPHNAQPPHTAVESLLAAGGSNGHDRATCPDGQHPAGFGTNRRAGHGTSHAASPRNGPKA